MTISPAEQRDRLPEASAADSRSLGELFSALSQDARALVRDELALARVEIGAKLTRARRYAGLLAVGGVLALTGLLTLIAAAVLVLVAVGMPPWGAAALVGLGLAALGALLAMRGLTGLRGEDLKPTATIGTLKEIAAWQRRTT